jgi:SAM-dependent methyltransferase
VRVGQLRPGAGARASSCETRYPVELIAATLAVKGPGSLCDELRRDEDPGYVQAFLHSAMLGYVAPEDFDGRRLLDFGSGSGSSALVLARMLPRTEIVGVDLDARYVELARLRAAHHGLQRLEFRVSPGPTELPAELGTFDFVSFSAVFEHLLPAERVTLLPRVWETLRPGGVLFLNQTPHRYFPVEYHTTGLPLLNYLPDAVALRVARRLSPRVGRDEPWDRLLRRGVRGATEGEVLRVLREAGDGRPLPLEPCRLGFADKLDLWHAAAGDVRHPLLKRSVLVAYRGMNAVCRTDTVPGLNMAIRKAS